MSDSNNDSLDALRDRLSKLGVDVDVDTVDTNTVPGVASGGVAAASEEPSLEELLAQAQSLASGKNQTGGGEHNHAAKHPESSPPAKTPTRRRRAPTVLPFAAAEAENAANAAIARAEAPKITRRNKQNQLALAPPPFPAKGAAVKARKVSAAPNSMAASARIARGGVLPARPRRLVAPKTKAKRKITSNANAVAWRPVAHAVTWENPSAHNGAITAAAARSVVAAQKRLDLEEARYRDYSKLLRDQERSHVADLGRERRTAEAYRREALRIEREAAALASLLDQRDRELERARDALRASQSSVGDAVAKAEVAEVRFAEEMARMRSELETVIDDRDECRRLLEAAMTRIQRAEDVAARFDEHERERRRLEAENSVLRISLQKVEKKCAHFEEMLGEQAQREALLKRISQANLAAYDAKKNALNSYMAAMASDGAALAAGEASDIVYTAEKRATGRKKVRAGTSVKELYRELLAEVEDTSTLDAGVSADAIARRAFRSPEVVRPTARAAAADSESDDGPLMRSMDASAAADRINSLLFGGGAAGGAIPQTPAETEMGETS
ncbi:hypothetical protein NFJ02_41g107700 [Pycnococcus provasolii]